MNDQNFLKIICCIYKQNFKNIQIFSNFKYLLYLKKKKIILFKPSKNFIGILKVFVFLLTNKIRFKKNFIIFTEVKNVIYGRNIFPEWTGSYAQSGITLNLYIWIKNFIFNFIHLKNMKCILIEKYDI